MDTLPRVGEGAGAARALALGQGLYWSATGAWPLVHLPSFEAVTGPKRERWLVRTAGALILVVGGTLALAARAGRLTPEVRLLGAAAAGAMAAVDAWYAGARRRISPVYLADAVLEAALVAAWIRWARPRGAGREAER